MLLLSVVISLFLISAGEGSSKDDVYLPIKVRANFKPDRPPCVPITKIKTIYNSDQVQVPFYQTSTRYNTVVSTAYVTDYTTVNSVIYSTLVSTVTSVLRDVVFSTRYVTNTATVTLHSDIPRTTTVSRFALDYATRSFPVEHIVYNQVKDYVTSTVDTYQTITVDQPVLLPTKTLEFTTAPSKVYVTATETVTDYQVVTSTEYIQSKVAVTQTPQLVTVTRLVYATAAVAGSGSELGAAGAPTAGAPTGGVSAAGIQQPIIVNIIHDSPGGPVAPVGVALTEAGGGFANAGASPSVITHTLAHIDPRCQPKIGYA